MSMKKERHKVNGVKGIKFPSLRGQQNVRQYVLS